MVVCTFEMAKESSPKNNPWNDLTTVTSFDKGTFKISDKY